MHMHVTRGFPQPPINMTILQYGEAEKSARIETLGHSTQGFEHYIQSIPLQGDITRLMQKNSSVSEEIEAVSWRLGEYAADVNPLFAVQQTFSLG